MNSRKVEISQQTILFVFGLIGAIWLIWEIREVIILLFMALILMSALAPLVARLERYRIPKPLAIALVYLLIVASIVALVSIGITPLIEQTNNLIRTLPVTIERILPPNFINAELIASEIGSFTGNALNATLTVFGEIIAVISVGVLTFYLLIEHDRVDEFVRLLSFGRDKQAIRIVRRTEEKLGAWFRGQVVLSLIIFVMSYIVLSILGVPYALPLSILAGLFEVVPVIGPILASIPAIVVAYFTSPILGLFTAGAFFIIQQLENNVVVPQVMKKAVGLNPLIVILAVAVGGKLLGFAGALLAVPIAVVIQIVLEEVLSEKQEQS